MAKEGGIFSESEVKDLTKKQRRDLRTYHVGNLVSSREISKLTRKDPNLALQIGKVAKRPASLRAFVRKRKKIQRILKAAARPMLAQMKKKK